IMEDFVTLGLIRRPWAGERFGPTGTVFAYYKPAPFDPEMWRPGDPNPAFGRMSERDAAWMARIMVDFTEDHIRALIRTAQFGDPELEAELLRILMSRRDKI